MISTASAMYFMIVFETFLRAFLSFYVSVLHEQVDVLREPGRVGSLPCGIVNIIDHNGTMSSSLFILQVYDVLTYHVPPSTPSTLIRTFFLDRKV